LSWGKKEKKRKKDGLGQFFKIKPKGVLVLRDESGAHQCHHPLSPVIMLGVRHTRKKERKERTRGPGQTPARCVSCKQKERVVSSTEGWLSGRVLARPRAVCKDILGGVGLVTLQPPPASSHSQVKIAFIIAQKEIM